MAHNIDITNGQASFVSAREDAWHQLGITLPDVFTAEDAMVHGNLGGWNVRKLPAYAATPDGRTLPMAGRYAVVRDNPVEPDHIDFLGDVGSSYRIIQNEEHADLLNALVEESGAHFETAGTLDGGRRVFLTMKIPGHMKIGGVDQIDQYIAAVNSHDGTSAFTFMVTPVRIVCQNTMNAAFQSHSNIIRVRHTRGADRILIQQVRDTLELTFSYLDGFQEEAERMIQQTMTQNQFDSIIAKEFGVSEDAPAGTVTRTENKLDEMSRLFADADTHKEVRNTVWAGFNALVEWYDHFSPTRGEDRDTARALNSVFDPSFKNKARSLMLARI